MTDKIENKQILTIILTILLWEFSQLYLFADVGKLTLQGTIMMVCIPSAFYSVIMMFTKSNGITFLITTLISTLIRLVDLQVYSVRLTHIHLSDIYSIKDAFRIMWKYPFSIQIKSILIAFSVILLNVIVICLSKETGLNKKWKRLFPPAFILLIISIATLIICSLTGFISYEIGNKFDINGEFERKGIYYSILCQIYQREIKEPLEYKAKEMENYLNLLNEDLSKTNETIQNVQIIAIMNESFCDYNLIGQTTFEDPLKEIHNETNNYFEGKLMTSVYGGYTCNTEFEFLTGCSMAFFPTETVPYVQIVSKRTCSICKDLSKYGYNSIAIHPYYSQEWNREKAYNLLGFQKFVAGENFSTGIEEKIQNITDTNLKRINFGENLEYIRGFISDRECYRKIIEETNKEKNNFTFAVTIQNHGGYGDTNGNYKIKNYVDKNSAVNDYLTSIAVSDKAFKELTDELKLSNNKTVVLMFGDHQPGLNFSEYVQGYGTGFENLNMYCVPYIVWSNFPLEKSLPETLSANYLSAVLKNTAGLPLTAWDKYRLNLMEEYPVITANFIMDNEGNFVENENMPESIREYEKLQYYRLFDEKSD